MTGLTEGIMIDRAASPSPRAGMRLLMQMAEVLEDQAAGLYRRAAVSEEEEFGLNREIEERQTEINRLSLKMEALRAERERLMEKIASISEEATAIREEIFSCEEEDALASIEAVPLRPDAGGYDVQAFMNPDPAVDAPFFRRMPVTEQTPDL